MFSALVEPIDATIYVYARGGKDQKDRVDCDGQGGDGISPHVAGSDAGGGNDEGDSDEGDSDKDDHNHTLDSNCPFNTTSSNYESGTTLPISLIFSAPFIKSSEPIPPSPHIPTQLAFTIAELYGPLRQPSDSNSPPVSAISSGLLELIPPGVRPHAHDIIIIPFDELAEFVLDSTKKLRPLRATRRGANIVDREWVKVWDSEWEAREVKQREECQLERAERVVERRKRKSQYNDVEVDPCTANEERVDASRVTRLRVQEKTYNSSSDVAKFLSSAAGCFHCTVLLVVSIAGECTVISFPVAKFEGCAIHVLYK